MWGDYEDDREYTIDRCGCGSRDVTASVGGEPYCGDCWNEYQSEKRTRALKRDGLTRERFTDIAGCLWLFRRDGLPARVVVESAFICQALFDEVAEQLGRPIVRTETYGNEMTLHLGEPQS